MMKKIIFLIIAILTVGCSIAVLLPEACVTIKIVDEDGKPLKDMPVGVGFERNTGSSVTAVATNGRTNADGIFQARGKTTNYVHYRIETPEYYISSGKYNFEREIAKKWQPWNPEITLVLRKIEKPVPMYARNTHESKHIELPVIGKAIGFDLISYDWVKPYGKGEHADFVFKLEKQSIDDNNYDATLLLSFSRRTDGILTLNEDRFSSSEFKLPRYAPVDGYNDKIIF